MRLSVLEASGLSSTLLTILLTTVGGCRLSGSQSVKADGFAGPTQVDRLMAVYPDLESGRFLIIADFEDPKHMELFHFIRGSDNTTYGFNPERGRKESGSGCLEFIAGPGAPGDTIVINNSSATHWHLKRDWRDYDLLLMSIHSPQRNLAAEMTIGAGPADQRLAASASIRLQQGWNLVRLDLAEIGERIPLDNVQEIRFAVSGASQPVELRLDDIVLTGNRKDLFGDSDNRGAGLYVQQVGRRWKIGAKQPGSDFELTFANGQIVEWYNVAADPYRLRNLLRGTTLGPNPLLIDGVEPGSAVVVRSRIEEMNTVRTVITSEWRFVDDPASADAGLEHQPFRRWVYTIYATGQIYVGIEATAETGSDPKSQWGLAVTFLAPSDGELQTYLTAQPDGSQTAGRPAYATARIQPNDAFFLYVVDDANRPVRIRESVPDPDDSSPTRGDATSSQRTSFVAEAGEREGNVEKWACHLFIGSASKISDEEALARAIDYVRPAAPRLELGSFVPVAPASGWHFAAGTAALPHPETEGFDPTSGCYVIVPDQGRVRFVIDATQRPRFSPAFQIMDADQQDAWVYVDHLIFDHVARDARGNLIFQLPSTIRKRLIVEVLFPRSKKADGA